VSQATNTFVDQNKDRLLEELKEFLRIPSISTLPDHAADVQRAAQFVAASLRAAGLENVEVIPTAKHPLVYADWLHAPGKPTVLCYGHYDVQPPDPLELWISPPFEPTIRDGNLYARGSCDDKGQMYMHVKAIEALRAVNGTLPVNVKFLIEGEEEVGGESIAKYVAENPAKLKADVALVSDTSLYAEGVPTRSHLHRNRSARTGSRSAFGCLRRRRAERCFRIGGAALEIERRERQDSDPRHV
jgi:acetylornithine deacetylase/succinyl-diaminopimelate desuccinylase-like protein